MRRERRHHRDHGLGVARRRGARRSTSSEVALLGPDRPITSTCSGAEQPVARRRARSRPPRPAAAARPSARRRRPRAASGRTRGPSPAAGSAAAVALVHDHERLVDQRGRPRRARRRRRAPRRRPSSENPSRNTASRRSATCSSASSRFQLQSMTASRVWCRSGAAAAAAAQQREPVVQPSLDLLHRHHPHLGGRQLDRERQPVEPVDQAATRSSSRRTPGRAAVARSRNSSDGVVAGRAAAAGRPARRPARAAPGSWSAPAAPASGRPASRPGRRPPRRRARSCPGSAASGVARAARRSGRPGRPAGRASRQPAAGRRSRARPAPSRPRRPRPRARVTPASSTKCTTGCSASRPITCASRVLPEPAGADDRGHPRGRGSVSDRAATSSSRPIRAVASYCRPARTGLVAGQQLGVQRLQGSDPGRSPRRSREIHAVALVALQRGRGAAHRLAAQHRRSVPRRPAAAAASSRSGLGVSPSARSAGRAAGAALLRRADASRQRTRRPPGRRPAAPTRSSRAASVAGRPAPRPRDAAAAQGVDRSSAPSR